MHVGLKLIGKAISKFTDNGCALVRKECGLNIAEALSEGIRIPKGAKTYDAVRVGRKFKPNEHYTDVFTFRNEQGEIIGKTTKKIDGDDIVQTTKTIEEEPVLDVELNEAGTEFVDVFCKRTRSSTRTNGKLTSITDEAVSVTDEANPVVTRFKREITPDSKERIFIDQRQKGAETKFIDNEYQFNEYRAGYSELTSSKVSSPELKEIAEDSYFLAEIGPTKNFARRLTEAEIQDLDFIDPPNVTIHRTLNGRCGYFSTSDGIHIKLYTDRGRIPRENIADVVGHEVGHAKWDERTTFLSMYDAGLFNAQEMKAFMGDVDINDVIKYKDAIDNYTPYNVDYKKYWNNFAEKTARKEGMRAADKHQALVNKIKKEFPFTHPSQYRPVSEIGDDDTLLFFNYLLTRDT